MLESQQSAARSYMQLVTALELNLTPSAVGGDDNGPPPTHLAAGITPADFVRVCGDGERTGHLEHLAGGLIGAGCSVRVATDVCLGWNRLNDPPLPEGKIRATVASIARTHARNHPTIDDCDTPLFDLSAARVDRFLDTDPPPRRWLIKDCLPLGKAGMLVGPGAVGKSQWSLQLSVAIACGGSLADYWRVGEQGSVLALFAEEDDEELHRRLHAIVRGLAARGVDMSTLETNLRARLYIKSLSGVESLMTRADVNGSVIRTSFAERLCDVVRKVKDIKLIIIDPVSRFRGGNENFAEDATRFVEAAEFIARETGATVLLLHHANKASTFGEDQHQGASRGSSALTDGVRWQMNLSALTDKQWKELGVEGGARHEYVAAKITKNNYGPAGDVVYLHREAHGVLAFHDQQETQRSSELERFKLLVTIIREQAAAQKLYSKSSFSKAYGGREGPFKQGVNALDALVTKAVAAGYLTQSPDGGRHLIGIDKPVGIMKAKLPGGGHAHGGG